MKIMPVSRIITFLVNEFKKFSVETTRLSLSVQLYLSSNENAVFL
jgi:hypothetical protein